VLARDELFMCDANCAQAVSLAFAHLGGNLDLRGATLADLNLSGASIAGNWRERQRMERAAR
jgi:hypothetical protein